MPFQLTQEQECRYARNIVLQSVGKEGQQKLLESKVLVVGVGGLGSPAAYYLTAAGIGTLGIADNDSVDLSNLQRQILHFTSDIGSNKTESAKEKLNDLNPDVKIVAYKERLNKDNIIGIIKGYDFVVDATDNFSTRFLLNDACVILKKPLSHGAVLGFDGQATTFTQEDDSACYRCIYPEAPPQGAIPGCQEAGVLGAVPGIIGIIQATEVIKYLLEFEHKDLLKNRILVYDSIGMHFRELKIKKDQNCPACSRENMSLDDFLYEENSQPR